MTCTAAIRPTPPQTARALSGLAVPRRGDHLPLRKGNQSATPGAVWGQGTIATAKNPFR